MTWKRTGAGIPVVLHDEAGVPNTCKRRDISG